MAKWYRGAHLNDITHTSAMFMLHEFGHTLGLPDFYRYSSMDHLPALMNSCDEETRRTPRELVHSDNNRRQGSIGGNLPPS